MMLSVTELGDKGYKLITTETNIVGKWTYRNPNVTKLAKGVSVAEVVFNMKCMYENSKEYIEDLYNMIFKDNYINEALSE